MVLWLGCGCITRGAIYLLLINWKVSAALNSLAVFCMKSLHAAKSMPQVCPRLVPLSILYPTLTASTSSVSCYSLLLLLQSPAPAIVSCSCYSLLLLLQSPAPATVSCSSYILLFLLLLPSQLLLQPPTTIMFAGARILLQDSQTVT